MGSDRPEDGPPAAERGRCATSCRSDRRIEPLELNGLNVLIGPNGSGKSNLLEAIALLRTCPNR